MASSRHQTASALDPEQVSQGALGSACGKRLYDRRSLDTGRIGQFQILKATDRGAEKDVKKILRATLQAGTLSFTVQVGETARDDDVRFALDWQDSRLVGYAQELREGSQRISVVFERIR